MFTGNTIISSDSLAYSPETRSLGAFISDLGPDFRLTARIGIMNPKTLQTEAEWFEYHRMVLYPDSMICHEFKNEYRTTTLKLYDA